MSDEPDKDGKTDDDKQSPASAPDSEPRTDVVEIALTTLGLSGVIMLLFLAPRTGTSGFGPADATAAGYGVIAMISMVRMVLGGEHKLSYVPQILLFVAALGSISVASSYSQRINSDAAPDSYHNYATTSAMMSALQLFAQYRTGSGGPPTAETSAATAIGILLGTMNIILVIMSYVTLTSFSTDG